MPTACETTRRRGLRSRVGHKLHTRLSVTHWGPGVDSVFDAPNAANRATIQVGRLRGRPLPDDPLESWRR